MILLHTFSFSLTEPSSTWCRFDLGHEPNMLPKSSALPYPVPQRPSWYHPNHFSQNTWPRSRCEQ
ncbi:hypothetical protein BDV19DRAFT_368001 [Aspergillus venezuelensis]